MMAKQGTSTVVPRLRFPEFRGSDAWMPTKLGKVLKFQVGFPFSSKGFSEEGPGLRLIRNRDLRSNDKPIYYIDPYSIDFVVSDGDVLVGMDGDFTPCVWGGGDALLNQRVGRILPKSDNVRRFLLYFLTSHLKAIEDSTARTTVKHLSHSDVEKTCEPLPCSKEQQKIADCLTSLDEVIAAQGRIVAALKAHKRGLMQQLFPREGETRPRLRFPEFRDAPEWELAQLGDVCRPQQWQTISSLDLIADGFPVYGANGFIGYYSTFNHEFETVAVTCRGSTCGEVLLIPPKSYITGNSMCLDDIDAKKHSYHFIFHLLKHRGLRDVISGSAQPQIVGKAIRTLKFLLPKLPEQQRIANCLSSLDDQIAAESHQLAALKTHKQGLMQQLFPAPGQAP